ncbi:hypothetical protein [Streptomyces sp. NPDC051098]|uniref:hypothetical protein n=1 Tax=Streptomyces sp. NPDC051098 TaxID=3155411 RepID=UPI00341346C4
MNSTDFQIAGQFTDLGNSWLNTLGSWGDKALQVALVAIVVITVVRKVSLKAGIGALIGLVIALGIYNSRGSLADKFEDEVNNPASGHGAISVVIPPDPNGPGAGGAL